MSDWTQLLQATAALAWPIIVGLLLWGLFPVIRNIISSKDFTVKFGGVEVSVQKATDEFKNQLNDLNEQVGQLRSLIPKAPESDASGTAPPPVVQRHVAILWVDDKPDGNALEVAQLREREVEVIQACSSAEGMAILHNRSDIAGVISDMGRIEEGQRRPEAGLDLLRSMRAAGIDLPFIMYTGRRSAMANHSRVTAEHGDGATASTIELFEWINQQVKRSP